MEEPNVYSFWDLQILSKQQVQEGIETDRVPEDALQKALKYINQAVQVEKNKHIRKRLDKVLHSPAFKALAKIAVAVNLLIVYFKYPPISSMQIKPYIYFIIEILCLSVLALQLLLRFLVQKWKDYSRNLWNWASFVSIVAIFTDHLISLLWTSHIIPTAVLKLVFLADLNSYSRSLLRLMVFTALRMIKVVGILITYILFYSLLGMILFRNQDSGENVYFTNFLESFLSMVVCLSTANFPDVMIPSYRYNPVLAIIFFVSFLSFGLFFGMNFILATAYKNFHERAAHEVLKKYMYQRTTLLKAFYILDEAETRKIRTMFISRPTFIEIIRRGNPSKLPEVIEELETLDEHIPTLKFFKLCDTYIIREWSNWDTEKPCPSYEQISEMVKQYQENLSTRRSERNKNGFWRFLETGATTREKAKRIFNHWATQAFFVFVMIGNAAVIVLIIESGRADTPKSLVALDWIFLGIFLLEVGVRICTRGIFSRKWNIFDIVILGAALVGKVTVTILFYAWLPERNHEYLLVQIGCFFSLIKLVRVVSVLKQARTFVKSVIQILAIIGHFAIVIFSVLYLFAVIGMICFHGVFIKGNTKLVGTAYDQGDYYNLVNFETFQGSLMLLFHLSIVNNWFVTMRAAMTATSTWACIYFLLFYYSMIVVVLNVAIAFVIEAVKFINESEDETTQGKRVHAMEEQIMANRLEEISRSSIQHPDMKEKFQASFASNLPSESRLEKIKKALVSLFTSKQWSKSGNTQNSEL